MTASATAVGAGRPPAQPTAVTSRPSETTRREPCRELPKGRKIGHEGLFGLFIERQRLRHPFLNILDARAVARMRGKKLRRLPAASRLHALPDGDRFVRVITGLRREEKTNAIGFGLVLAAEGEEQAHLGAKAQSRHGAL